MPILGKTSEKTVDLGNASESGSSSKHVHAITFVLRDYVSILHEICVFCGSPHLSTKLCIESYRRLRCSVLANAAASIFHMSSAEGLPNVRFAIHLSGQQIPALEEPKISNGHSSLSRYDTSALSPPEGPRECLKGWASGRQWPIRICSGTGSPEAI